LARRERWTDLYRRIQERLFPLMRPAARLRAAQLFETFLADPNRFTFRPVLTHRDFATSNILVTGTPAQVSGIIDFGAAGLADPAANCAAIINAFCALWKK
jgi:aminoglycoside 2''-phosphotransferase